MLIHDDDCFARIMWIVQEFKLSRLMQILVINVTLTWIFDYDFNDKIGLVIQSAA
jgi:hypothetical protein